MSERGTQTFGDPVGYAAAFGDARVDLTIMGAGDFTARLTRLKLRHLEVYWCRESLPRIAYISLPPERVVLSFPIGGHLPCSVDLLCETATLCFTAAASACISAPTACANGA
jgi:hypothetical protein